MQIMFIHIRPAKCDNMRVLANHHDSDGETDSFNTCSFWTNHLPYRQRQTFGRIVEPLSLVH